MLRQSLARGIREKNFRLATAVAGDLIYLLNDSGRFAEALALVDQKSDYTRKAGLGPWTRLGDQAFRLETLGLMGEHARVATEAAALITEMERLPEKMRKNETAPPWGVWEMVLGAAYFSVQAAREWQLCLELNSRILDRQRRRRASPHDLANTRLDDVRPLVELGRADEARHVLQECRQVYEEYNDLHGLARIFEKLAALELELGHQEVARG